MRTFTLVVQLLSIAVSAPLAFGWAPSISPHKVRTSPTSFAIAARNNKHSDNETTKAIKEAILITKKYGTTSFRAKIAWEVVEKIEYSYQVRSKSNTDKKDLDIVEGDAKKKDAVVDIVHGDEAYDLVENNVRDLKELLDKEMAKVKEMKTIAHKIKVSLSQFFNCSFRV